MNLKICLSALSLLFGLSAQAQHDTWVFFTDKGAQASLLSDYDALSPHDVYLREVEMIGCTVLGTSAWLNAAYVNCTSAENESALKSKSFVNTTRKPGNWKVSVAEVANGTEKPGASDVPLQMLRLDSFHRMGYTGQGIRLALFDAGFEGVDTLEAFSPMFESGQIMDTADFVEAGRVFTSSGHGTAVLGLAGIRYPDSLLGAAPGARFLLARTEDVRSETHKEELNWVNAMEWAANLDADIIHSSLGYSEFDSLEGDYTYADMDGASTIITLATDIAASKGIFVTNSAGNQGEKPWRFITAPCDGFKVLCVGAVDSFRQHAAFSSYGPSADGRVKPEVMAMGHRNTVIGTDGILKTGSGTSFSGPIIAGLVACLKQAYPNTDNALIFQAIIRSCDRYENPDSAYGYGIPDVLKADSLLRNNLLNTELVRSQSPQVWPNPSEGALHFSGLNGSATLEIFSMNGARILSQDLNQSEAVMLPETLKNGPYIWLIRSENGASRGVIHLLR